MNIYLIRHTTPLVAKGTCYGQADLDVTDSFDTEVASIKKHIPLDIETVYSSPLQRCKKLAGTLFPQHNIITDKNLMELNCGNWELQLWDAIPKPEIQPWMDDFINTRVPGGESYLDMYGRVVDCFETICKQQKNAAIVAHGGVLRSVLAHITQTPLKAAFDVFTFHYGCVIKLSLQDKGFLHEAVYNVQVSDKEWHRPSIQ